MRILLLFTALLSVVVLGNSSVSPAPNVSVKEKAVASFDGKVTLMGIRLDGQYLFVHDDMAMLRGEACTYVYKGEEEKQENLIVSFHCIPKMRPIADRFIVRTLRIAPRKYELREFQFAGSPEGHVVPVGQHVEHVTIVGLN